MEREREIRLIREELSENARPLGLTEEQWTHRPHRRSYLERRLELTDDPTRLPR